MLIALMVPASIMISAIAEQLQERIKSHRNVDTYRTSRQPQTTLNTTGFSTVRWKPQVTQFLLTSVYIGAVLGGFSMPTPVLVGVEVVLVSAVCPEVSQAIARLVLLAFGVTAFSLIWWSSTALAHLPLLLTTILLAALMAVALLAGIALIIGLGAALAAADPKATFFRSPSLPLYQSRFILATLATVGLAAGYWGLSGLL